MCTVMVIRQLGKKCIHPNRDSSDVLRHIIKIVSKRLVRTIEFLFKDEKRGFPKQMEESDGESCSGSDTVEDTEERAIRENKT